MRRSIIRKGNCMSETVDLTLRPDELELLIDGLHSLEYWDYATELDLPRRNGEVFLPEDDPSWWQGSKVGDDELNAITQIRRIRELAKRITRNGASGSE